MCISGCLEAVKNKLGRRKFLAGAGAFVHHVNTMLVENRLAEKAEMQEPHSSLSPDPDPPSKPKINKPDYWRVAVGPKGHWWLTSPGEYWNSGSMQHPRFHHPDCPKEREAE